MDGGSYISGFEPYGMNFFLRLLSCENLLLEVNLCIFQRKKNKTSEEFCFMLPDMFVFGMQLSLGTESSAPG